MQKSGVFGLSHRLVPPPRRRMSSQESAQCFSHSSRVLMFISSMAANHQLSMLQHSDRQETDGGLIITVLRCLSSQPSCTIQPFQQHAESKERRFEEVKTEVQKNVKRFFIILSLSSYFERNTNLIQTDLQAEKSSSFMIS